MNEDSLTKNLSDYTGILISVFLIFILFIALWIWAMVYATRKKGVLGFCLVFFLGFIGWIIVAVMDKDEPRERERERERERDEIYLWNLLYQISWRVAGWGNHSGRENLSLLFRKEARRKSIIS